MSLSCCGWVFQAGANMIVSGSAVVKSDNPRQVIAIMKEKIDKWLKGNCEAERQHITMISNIWKLPALTPMEAH